MKVLYDFMCVGGIAFGVIAGMASHCFIINLNQPSELCVHKSLFRPWLTMLRDLYANNTEVNKERLSIDRYSTC